jgi:hypothetical protein
MPEIDLFDYGDAAAVLIEIFAEIAAVDINSDRAFVVVLEIGGAFIIGVFLIGHAAGKFGELQTDSDALDSLVIVIYNANFK